jgi:pimeloyl-ACP methyl ester carboxylesterase
MIDRYYDLQLYPGNRHATSLRFAVKRVYADPATLAAIKVPTLILWGDEDKLIPVASAHWFAKAIPGAKEVIYPRIGHIPMEEAADHSAKDADMFLSAIVPPPQK